MATTAPGRSMDNREKPPWSSRTKSLRGIATPMWPLSGREAARRVACEACHGAQSVHASADDPAAAKPKLPDAKTLCLVCHQENVAKPKGFPQVNPKEHNPPNKKNKHRDF